MEVDDFISELRHRGSGGMMCQGVRKEIQMKGVIGDPIHFDTLGDMQGFVKMLVSIVTRNSMKSARILNLLKHVILKSKVHCLNSNLGNWSTMTIQRWLAEFLHSPKDACPNDCMLFHGDDKFLDSCSICEASRYKKFNNDNQDDDDNLILKRKILAKQVDDGLMKHHADSPAWNMFNKKYPEFGCESRNVRLGLASDGFNPFRTMTISHTLGDKIDVYLQLLIDELKDLWRDGVSTYDASSKRHQRWLKENNKLRRDKAAFNGEPEWDP
uniref:Uncharacterized protein n=1 Tax=Tanacetum cinerariifolium TaxID=118510 RepID=A0A699IM22_TANCI|nr:hypothetical protein [Tanacetum cinerariifolium]